MELTGKTALITGGAIRIGKAISLALAEKGCNLLIHYNSSDSAALSVANEAQQMGVRVEVIQADLSDLDQVLQIFPKALKHFNHVDILINNAGVYLKGKGLETDFDSLNTQFMINLYAPFLLTQAFAKQLPEQLIGKVVNISDARVFHQQIDHFAYRLTKSSLNEMTVMFALELAPRITVNALALGIMLPLAGYEHIDLDELAKKRVPLKSIGSPEIAAQNVLHILDQDFMTGTIIRLDGGEFIQ